MRQQLLGSRSQWGFVNLSAGQSPTMHTTHTISLPPQCMFSVMCHCACCSPVAPGHDNGQLLLWHMDTGSHTVLGPQTHSNTVSCLSPVITAKGDEQLVSGGFDGLVCLWEPRQVRGVKPHLIARCGGTRVTERAQLALALSQLLPVQQTTTVHVC